jgi:hypothetical protein
VNVDYRNLRKKLIVAGFCFAEELFVDELNWLKYNSQPWTEVLEKWKITSSFRVAAFHKGVKNVGEFTILSNPKMDNLVHICSI